MEERAAHYGVTVDRDAWRLVGIMHLAETREQAYADVAHGIEKWFDYFQHTAAFPQMDVGQGTNVREYIDFVNESGIGSVGTPDDAVEQIDRLWKQSNGGFRHVAPRFQGQQHATAEARNRARAARPVLAESNLKAVEMSTAKYEAEKASS